MPTRGRPRTFDRDEAVKEAMYAFWEHGYESTSLAILKERIAGGITAPSFYAAFKSKEDLFEETVRYYNEYQKKYDRIEDFSLSPRDAIEQTLRLRAILMTEDHTRPGCFVGFTVTCDPKRERIQNVLKEHRQERYDAFHKRVQEAVDIGDLPADTNVAALTASLCSFVFGMSIQARDGASYEELLASVNEIIMVWDLRAKQ